MTSSLTIIAGRKARQHLLNHGFRQEDFEAVLAASGGPKWFILFGLDKYLFGEFFKDRTQPIHTLGSSAGAWQLSCFAQPDPVKAITTLAENYANETYSVKPTPEEITTKAEILLDSVFSKSGIAALVDHPIVKTHILADRCRGLVASERSPIQMLGLGLTAASNAISRRLLRYSFERTIFHANPASHFQFNDHPTHYAKLTAKNGRQALMASAAIPLLLNGVRNIPGAPSGIYRDGGIIDYHFDLPMGNQGLVLYPHFSHRVVPGWFDKKLPYRQANPKHYDNVVILAPSRKLIASLPQGKISDRTDFTQLNASTRQRQWRTILNASERLADDFHELTMTNLNPSQIMSFPATHG